FTSQFSYDLSQTNSNNGSSRRRHRSEINHSTTNPARSAATSSQFTNDDYFMNGRVGGSNQPTAASSIESDLNTAANDKYCRCWCQCWAEILLRRATGNTRMIVRIENTLGDFPYWSFS